MTTLLDFIVLSRTAANEWGSAMRLLLIMGLIGTLSACETVKGIGRDITRAAETVDRF